MSNVAERERGACFFRLDSAFLASAFVFVSAFELKWGDVWEGRRKDRANSKHETD